MRHQALVTAAALSFTWAGMAGAQEFGVLNSLQSFIGSTDGNIVAGQRCTMQPSSFAPTCTMDGGVAEMSHAGGMVVVRTRNEAAVGGPLRSSSHVTVTDGNLDLVQAFGRAGYYDALHVGTSEVAFARFMVSVDGVSSFSAGLDNPLTNSYGTFSIGNYGPASVPGNYGVNPNPRAYAFESPADGATRTAVIQVPLSVGTNNLLFAFSAVTALGRPLDESPTWSATAYTDFMHTAQVQGITLHDATGRDITAEATWGFASGTTFATVPEPGTWVMLGTGLLGLAGVRRMRRSEGDKG